MATRFYYQAATGVSITPSFSAGWDVNAGAVRRALLVNKITGESGSFPQAGTGVANQNRLICQHIGEPMSAQTIAGTIKGQSRANETNAGVDHYYPQTRVYVVNFDGTIVRGVLLDLHTNALSSEFAASLTNRQFPLAALSPAILPALNVQGGDRLVVERGWRQTSTAVANGGVSARTTSATDLPEDETTTSNFNDWIEFSQDIMFYGGPYSARISLTNIVVSAPCRLRQVVVIPGAAAGSFVLRDGSASGQVRMGQVDTPAGAGTPFDIDIPAGGLRFYTGIHATLTNCEIICRFN